MYDENILMVQCDNDLFENDIALIYVLNVRVLGLSSCGEGLVGLIFVEFIVNLKLF
jgi:hypothetical protein